MATTEMTLEAALRSIRLERQAAETELSAIESRRRELREAIRDCDRRRDELLDDLVVDRPLLDFAAAVQAPDMPGPAESMPGPSPDMPEPATAYTWHSYPIERALGVEGGFNEGLAGLLLAEDLGTLGALASYLSDGNDLEDIEVPTDDQGDKVRPLTTIEVRTLRAALLNELDKLGVPADEFPRSWVDPNLGRKLYRVDFKGKARTGPSIFLRAFTKMQAAVEAERRWPDSRAVVLHEGEPPQGARIFDAPRESPEERAAQFEAEERVRRAEEEQAKADREAKASEERVRAQEEAARQAPPSLFSVRPKRQKTPTYFVRAASLREACEHVRSQHPADARLAVTLWDGELPKDAAVFTAGQAAGELVS